ncbi:MAG: hypothetical protein JWL89_300 [Candidatus Saccharibacteria bacterium]|nr:hypothetical protein [Candidatus Saccharibacteria bacterium]
MSEQITLYDTLVDGQDHPVVSGLSFRGNEAISFWVEPDLEDIDPFGEKPRVAAVRVDFQPERFTREGADLAAIGRTALIELPHRLHVLGTEEGASVRMEQRLPTLAEEVFEKLKGEALAGDYHSAAPIVKVEQGTDDEYLGGIEIRVAGNMVITLLESDHHNDPFLVMYERPVPESPEISELISFRDIARRPKVNATAFMKGCGIVSYEIDDVAAVTEVVEVLEEALRTAPGAQSEYKKSVDYWNLNQYYADDASS